MKKRTWHFTILGTALLSVGTGCGGATTKPGDEPLITAKGAALHRANSCDDLLLQIQSDAIAKLDDVVAEYKANRNYYYYSDEQGAGGVIDVPGSDVGTTSGTGEGAPSGSTTATTTDSSSTGTSTGQEDVKGESDPAIDTDTGTGDGDASDEAAPGSHSETNTQVEDVDEADIVKIGDDGKRIYLIHGSEFKIVDAWPAEEMKPAGAAQVAGTPYELFVYEGKATVFSRISPSDLPSDSSSDSKDYPRGCGYGGGSFTQVSVFDVSGNTPSLEREMIFEGDYVSSRRHDGVVRAVVRGGFQGQDVFYPDVDFYDSFGREKSEERLAEDLEYWRNEVKRDIQNTRLEDWLPESYERLDDSWVEIDAQCDSYFIPEPGLVESGITQVVSFEPANSAAPQVTAVLGGSDTVYANHNSLYVAQMDYRWDRWSQGDGPRTALHKFSIQDASSSYVASGFVPGTPLNQFALDEREDVLRIATTDSDGSSDPENRIFTLKDQGTDLAILDRSEKLGEAGETIFAVRFIEDRGYVVTFQRTDPLYALDLADPSDIKVLGELHIPGFSEYIHPLGDNHLLTIGQGADDQGQQDGVALQIFDVSDATKPTQTAKYSFGGFSWSEAGYNHKAFTYVKDYFEGEDDLLLFPLVTYEPTYQTALKVLRVSESAGISLLGSIDHAGLVNRECSTFQDGGYPCYYYSGEEMRRGMQIDDYIYALSQGGLTVHEVDSLADGPLATVEFDRPTYAQQDSCYYYGDYGYYGGVGDTTSGSTGIDEGVTEPEMDYDTAGTTGATSTTSTTGGDTDSMTSGTSDGAAIGGAAGN